MILPQSSISFSLDHNTRRIRERIEFETSRTQFQPMKAEFLRFLDPLQKCTIPADLFRPIAPLALRVPNPKNPSKRGQEAWDAFNKHIQSLSEEYIGEVGENAYALLNVVSDLASRPSEAGLLRRERHSLQRLAGAWLAEFSSECKEASFAPPRYLRQLRASEPGLPESGNSGPASLGRRSGFS